MVHLVLFPQLKRQEKYEVEKQKKKKKFCL